MTNKYLNIPIITFIVVVTLALQTAAFPLFRKLESIEIEFDKNQLVLPGESFKIGIISHYSNGKNRKTVGLDDGTVWWWHYNVEVTGGKSRAGKITVNKQLMPSKGKFIKIKVTSRRNIKCEETILIALNYETDISFHPSTKFDKAPGCSFKGEIVSTFDNGIVRKCHYRRKGKEIENFLFSASGLEPGRTKFTIETDFEKIENHQVRLILQPLRNQALSDTFNIILDYKHNYNLLLTGSSGLIGFDGTNGSDGSDGRHGSDGQHGQNGSPGYDGPDIGVWTDMYFDSTLNCNLLYVFAENFKNGNEYKYLVNPNGGKLTVCSCGGSGGRGGDGGDGGNGGRGADGEIWYETVTKTRTVSKPFKETVTKKVKKTITNSEGEQEEIEEEVKEEITVYRDVQEKYEVRIKHQEPGQDGGNGGFGGGGGFGGPGGWGGNIYLYFTYDARAYENLIVAKSVGAQGGSHGYGGNGGNAGSGGSGNPAGRSGIDGRDGPSAVGWATKGYDGEIFRDWTKEFFFYETTRTKNR